MDRTSMGRWLVAAWAGLAGTLVGAAQPAPQVEPAIQPRLEPVDAGVADVGGGALGRTDLRRDLRDPLGFDRVYRLRPHDPFDFDGAHDLYVRQSGGITAVFPRSTYRPTAQGLEAEIPPGTVFHVGPLPAGLTGIAPRVTPSPDRVDLRAQSTALRWSARLADSADPAVAAAGAPAPEMSVGADGEPIVLSLFEDERYRQRRLSALLGRAAQDAP